jgi:hypothetical protein
MVPVVHARDAATVRSGLASCGWACLATFFCTLLVLCCGLTAGVLTTSWINALQGRESSSFTAPFKLLVATGLTFVAMAGAVRVACVTYCHLLVASTTLPAPSSASAPAR